jgi:hypothetical protein
MDSLRTAKVISVAAAILFGIALSWLWLNDTSNAQIRQKLDHERLRSKALLAEKLLAEKSVSETDQRLCQARDTLVLLKGQVSSLHRQLDDQHQNVLELSARCRLALRNLDKARARQKKAETTLSWEQDRFQKLQEENMRLFDSLRFYQTKEKQNGTILF